MEKFYFSFRRDRIAENMFNGVRTARYALNRPPPPPHLKSLFLVRWFSFGTRRYLRHVGNVEMRNT